MKILFEALDPRWTIHDMVAERDIVVIRWSHTGTHRGEFLGVPATGKEFTFRGIDVYRVLAGKLAEHWNVVDALGFLQQVGGAPSPSPRAWGGRRRPTHTGCVKRLT